MAFPENEVAVDNQLREGERLSEAPGGEIVANIKEFVSPGRFRSLRLD